MNKEKVVITLFQGVVEVAKFPENIIVEVWDYDIEGCEGDYPVITKDEDGEDVILSVHEHAAFDGRKN